MESSQFASGSENPAKETACNEGLQHVQEDRLDLFPGLEELSANPEKFINLAAEKLSLPEFDDPDDGVIINVTADSEEDLVTYLSNVNYELDEAEDSEVVKDSEIDIGLDHTFSESETDSMNLQSDLSNTVADTRQDVNAKLVKLNNANRVILPVTLNSSVCNSTRSNTSGSGVVTKPKQPGNMSVKTVIIKPGKQRTQVRNTPFGNGVKQQMHEGLTIQQVSPPLSESDISQSQCMTKTAIAARENRQKKKHYIGTLETSVTKLTTENKELKSNVTDLQGEIATLQSEVQYLRNVLANQSTLSALLKNVSSTPGIDFVTPELNNNEDLVPGRKRKLDTDNEESTPAKENVQYQKSDKNSVKYARKVQKLDHDYSGKNMSSFKKSTNQVQRVGQKPEENRMPSSSGEGGICLHVANNTVSLEFCSACSVKASTARKTKKS